MNIEKGTVHFISDMHLLEELGERMVASPSIAIAELIKNAYDADAVECRVWQGLGREKIFVTDDGHGITKDEFLTKWMTVATQNKREISLSRKYHRVVTGAKGVGRFATRFLGKSLKLQSYSYDTKAGAHARLEATFDWNSFDQGGPLTEIEIPYTYELGVENKHGTQLEIGDLRAEWNADTESRVRKEVLAICSPYPSLEHGNRLKRGKMDPGFSVLFAPPGQKTRSEFDVASEVLDRYLAKLRIETNKGNIEYTILFSEDGAQKKFHYKVAMDLIGLLHADIRYMPWGKGRFANFEHVNAKDAYQWVRESSGVKIFDHGFRVPPYGDKDDDWLRLASDTASNRRQWRSRIAESIFPRADLDKNESRDPALSLPGNHQLLGAVFLNSDQSKKAEQDKAAVQRLQVAMDRQGYLNNDGYLLLVEIVRGGLELLAVACKERDLKQKEKAVKEESDRVKKSFIEVIVDVEKSSLPPKEKRRFVKSLLKLEKDVRGLDVAHERARESIELMGLLGGLAGFLTHETETMLKTIDHLIHMLGQPNAPAKREIEQVLAKAKEARLQLDDQLNYAKTFLTGIGQRKIMRLYAHDQARLAIEKMRSFTEPRGIETLNEIPKKLLSAPTMAVVYGGILMNLYTNAIKAVLARRDTEAKRIHLNAENEGNFHILRVSDTGIGIADAARDRIFDPLYTTTSESPLGSGMGLGLSIIKRLVIDLGGGIALIQPEQGYSTTFQVKLPIKGR